MGAISGAGNDLDSALQPMRTQLAADGYELAADLDADRVLELRVVAGADACEECLVPKDLFASMVSDQLTSSGVSVDEIKVAYPADA